MSDLILPYGMGRRGLYDPILVGGHFYWYEATHGGSRIPQTREQHEGIVRLAKAAEEARKVVGPMVIISWLRTPQGNADVGGVSDSRHLFGDGMDFWCLRYPDPMDVYRLLDPWWGGGLGVYPHLRSCHIDARGYKARW